MCAPSFGLWVIMGLYLTDGLFSSIGCNMTIFQKGNVSEVFFLLLTKEFMVLVLF